MNYLIEGQLTREDKPDKYMNKFIQYFPCDGSGLNKQQVVIADTEEAARELNSKGFNLQWNDNLERAVELCSKLGSLNELRVARTISVVPSSWEAYLSEQFNETGTERTVAGELQIWKEWRFPSPWVYVASFGSLENIFKFSDSQFVPVHYCEGKRKALGLMLDNPLIRMNLGSVRKDVTYIPPNFQPEQG